MKRILSIIILLFITSFVFAEQKELIVNIAPINPCVITNDGHPTGFDVEIWEEVAKKLNIKFKYVVSSSHLDVIKNLKEGIVDVGIAGITITSDREEDIDFSNHYLDSGLRILILRKDPSLWDSTKIFWFSIQKPLMYFMIFMIAFAHLIWFCEKDKDPNNNSIDDKYIPGIFQAIYFCFVTCSTVGYGDFTPRKWAGKVMVILLIVIGIVAFCNFTAQLSSEYTKDKIDIISSSMSLNGKTVVTEAGSTSVGVIRGLGAKVKEVSTIDEAYNLLLTNKADALVYDSPCVLHYYQEHKKEVQLVGDLFDMQYYGFGLQRNSQLRKDINIVLLEIKESPKYKEIYNKWF